MGPDCSVSAEYIRQKDGFYTQYAHARDIGLDCLADRYKVLYGGRGGIKSWSVAQFLLYMGSKTDLRIPCARETMQSIRESVHQLLEDQITRLGLQAYYEVQKAEIIGRRTQLRIIWRKTLHGYLA